jgi:3-hydroxyacyl-CoA dehydrogenase
LSDIKTVACVGGGIIGASWAVNFSVKGFNVVLSTLEPLEVPGRNITKMFDFLISNGVLQPASAEEAKKRIQYTAEVSKAVSSADYIQENTPDNLELKKKIIAKIENHCTGDVIIASSTSNLLITDIAGGAKHPERIVGGHPYNPPHLIPLVEISKGKKTSDKTVEGAVKFYRSCGKEPVVLQKESIGFISNRLQMALYREAVDLVCRGVCTVEAVDKAVVFGPGLRWSSLGPNMLYQLGGGEGGLTGLLTALKAGGAALIADLADWKQQPEDWIRIAQAGVNEEMKNMPDFVGHSNQEIGEFRDKMLIALLRLHKKL